MYLLTLISSIVTSVCATEKKAVIWISRMTKPYRTLSAELAGIHPTVPCLPAVGAVVSLQVQVKIDLYREVTEWEGAHSG